jgi:hypothetical protein
MERRLEMCPLDRNEVEMFIVDGCLTLVGKMRERVKELTRPK